MSLLLLFQTAVSSSDITAAGSLSITGTADLDATGSLVAAGALSITGAADLDARGALLAAGSLSVTGAADLDASGKLVAAGALSITGAADLDAIGKLAAAGAISVTGAADLDAAGKLIAAGALSITGAADLDAVGQLLAAGSIVITGAADLASALESDLSASGALSITGTADLNTSETVEAGRTLGGDDRIDRGHRGYGKRATLKRKREREFDEQVRDIYRTLTGDPRTAERAAEIVASVVPSEPVRGESEAVAEAAALARAETLRRRADAMDAQALQAEIALRMLYRELRKQQDREDTEDLQSILPVLIGMDAQAFDTPRQQMLRDLWDDEFDMDAIEALLAQVL